MTLPPAGQVHRFASNFTHHLSNATTDAVVADLYQVPGHDMPSQLSISTDSTPGTEAKATLSL
jgi:hypothetical protein